MLPAIATALFQLHHTGIKTGAAVADGGLPDPFQLHHTGIKTWQLLSDEMFVSTISIAPYRN